MLALFPDHRLAAVQDFLARQVAELSWPATSSRSSRGEPRRRDRPWLGKARQRRSITTHGQRALWFLERMGAGGGLQPKKLLGIVNLTLGATEGVILEVSEPGPGRRTKAP